MKIQDLLKFSLEMVLPERLAVALQSLASKKTGAAPANTADGTNNELGKARSIIEHLDYGEFGGPSFGPETMQLMAQVLDEIRTELPESASDDKLREIATAILKAAADGERDLARLKSRAGAVAFAGAPPTADD